ncbi:YibE/F family protein [uncultured Flavonifractor sp.]|uniref:YibE/F family protein n=1 Tax=Candidatus Flavonifractor intestinigallinarum TaxID=2838586 RepID=A0A9D2SBB4_9FIRM|nr:YibE/F family protein [uncultured Flavonifractor sp.]HJB80421.1 YibE/F family protein [Candidatus Flavonifractor intestinigallinarum]
MGGKKRGRPAPLAKQTLWPPTRGRIVGAAVGLCLLLILVLGAVLLRPEDSELTAAQKRLFASARVTDVLAEDAQPDDWTEGLRLGSQHLELEILSGPYKGAVLEAINYLTAYANVDCDLGTRVIVRLDVDENGDPYVVSIPNYDRGIVLMGMLAVFALLLILIGGKKGIMALLGLIYTLAGIWFLLIPMVLKGAPSIPSAIFIAALTAVASLLMLTGFSRKTLCAGLGCVCGVAAAGLFAWIVGIITPISGFNMSEAEELVLRAYDTPLEIRGLLVSGILIAALGAVMDVAMSIASACHELRTVDPEITSGRLFRSGMNIGRDAMGTMANTLILAFAGASFNMLLLFQVYHYPMIQIINSDTMAIELIQSVAGSVGIILTVPLVSLFAALLLGKRKKQAG